jgi:hypothetical protein
MVWLQNVMHVIWNSNIAIISLYSNHKQIIYVYSEKKANTEVNSKSRLYIFLLLNLVCQANIGLRAQSYNVIF